MKSYKWPMFIVVVLVAVGLAGGAIYIAVQESNDQNEEILRERTERTAAFCEYAYNEKRYQRTDAISNYRRIPRASREILVLAGITIRPRKELIANLRTRYGNKRLPSYCPQSRLKVSIPEDILHPGSGSSPSR